MFQFHYYFFKEVLNRFECAAMQEQWLVKLIIRNVIENSKLGVESLIRECKITTYHLIWTTLNTNIHTSNSLRVAGVHSKMLWLTPWFSHFMMLTGPFWTYVLQFYITQQNVSEPYLVCNKTLIWKLH